MNAVEIEEALSDLAAQPFDSVEFPFSFLAALGNKDVTLKRLRQGGTNKSDVPGGLLQHNNIHLATCLEGDVSQTLRTLRDSPRTVQAKAKFVLATDGINLEAEELGSGEVLGCDFPRFADHFAFFLSLAGISTVKEIKENPIDVKATGRLNKIYVELLKNNPNWATDQRRPDMNHFMARLVFCYFAEDTDIFHGSSIFTRTMEQVTAPDGSNTHEVLESIFKAMNVSTADRPRAKLPSWAEQFPYVNGGLFAGETDVPTFSRTARSYLLRTGELNWAQINPDIFGSMIQAVADDEERGSLGMHYTSVPNILKVLNPLFLDELRAQLKAGGDNKAKLLNLRKRMSRVRVFDPACGSGNFLVIAYKQMRAIEAEINRQRGEPDLRTEIPLTNFRGIELRNFPAEIARLALVIAKFQCDVLHRGQKEALAEVLPLDNNNWITCGNALRLDWLALCPPTGTGVKMAGDDLFDTPLDQAEIDFENEGGETFICGNPPYLGSTWQTAEQKEDLRRIYAGRTNNWKSLDYVAGWFMKAADYGTITKTATAFVSTNSICQGQQVPILWPLIFGSGHEIAFAHTSFTWANLASNNAGVTVVIVGLSREPGAQRALFAVADDGVAIQKSVSNINAYLVPGPNVIVEKMTVPMDGRAIMLWGNKPADGGNLILDFSERERLIREHPEAASYIRSFPGASEFIQGVQRYCLWLRDNELEAALAVDEIRHRLMAVSEMRRQSPKRPTAEAAVTPNRFVETRQDGSEEIIVIPGISSENRPYLPCGLAEKGTILSNKNYAFFNAPLWNMSIVASRLHLIWIATVCVRLRTDYSYSNTLGWNTFPVPTLTEQNKADLTACAQEILLARESHFPATIADLYEPEKMPQDLRRAHEKNDEVLERIYIGRRFRNDTERLEKLFDLYTKTAAQAKPRKGAKAK
jgi:hypothetical protein